MILQVFIKQKQHTDTVDGSEIPNNHLGCLNSPCQPQLVNAGFLVAINSTFGDSSTLNWISSTKMTQKKIQTHTAWMSRWKLVNGL